MCFIYSSTGLYIAADTHGVCKIFSGVVWMDRMLKIYRSLVYRGAKVFLYK
jgi:hypothetical protein